MKTVYMTYAGQRLSGNGDRSQTYCICNEDGNVNGGRYVSFGKKVLGYESIGTVLKAEKVDDNTYKKFEVHNVQNKHESAQSIITQWSIEHRQSIERQKMISEAKKDHPASVDGLIDKVKFEMRYMNSSEQARIAMYVYNKLIK